MNRFTLKSIKNLSFGSRLVLSVTIASIFSLATSGCYYDNFAETKPLANLENACDSTVSVVSYTNHIVPILNNSCGTANSCHGNNSTSNINLSNYNGVYAMSQGYLLFHVVAWTPNYSKMPKGSQVKISDCNIALIRKWIDAGAPNN